MINKFETTLLKTSCEYYEKTCERRFEYQPSNSDDWFYYSDAARYLSDNGYITAISENIHKDIIDVIHETALIFEITDLGIAWVKRNSKPQA